MAEVTYRPAHVKGEVRIPPSKSAAHRALLSAALCKTPCRVGPIDHSADMEATLNGVCAMGGTVKAEENGVLCIAPGTAPQSVTVDCGESGSTLRFLIPVFRRPRHRSDVCRSRQTSRAPYRRLHRPSAAARRNGRDCPGGLPFHITGKLQSGDFRVPGNISSQFITGLLFALPLLKKDSTVTLTTPLESKGYIDLTIEVLAGFGVKIEETETGWHICGGQTYRAEHYTVEGDWSQAAFFLSEAAVSGGPIRLLGLSETSLQGDKACVHLWRQFGLSVTEENGVYVAENKNTDKPYRGLHGIAINAAQIPDMVPALAVTAAFAEGETVISHAERLHLKECDRLLAMEAALKNLGADIKAVPDGLIIHGKPALTGGKAEGMNDHRVVMALAAAGCACTVTVTDAESIKKSYPGFFRDHKHLGGIADGIDLG